MEPLLSPTVSPIQHTTYSGNRVEMACSVLAQNEINGSLNISWVKRTPGDDATTLSISPSASYHLQGHILVLERVRQSDSGRYCCQVGELQQEEACTELTVLSRGEDRKIVKKCVHKDPVKKGHNQSDRLL